MLLKDTQKPALIAAGRCIRLTISEQIKCWSLRLVNGRMSRYPERGMMEAGFFRQFRRPLFKRHFFAFWALFIVCMTATTSTADQDDLSPRQQEIIQTVLSVEGFITRELHTEFWASVPLKIRNDIASREAFVRFIDRSIATGIRFQRESWASMKASLKAGRVVKSPGYTIAKKSSLSATSNPAYQQQAQKAVTNAENMIKAAAQGRPFQTPRGPMYITPELVNQVLAGLDGAVDRFRRLANPNWEEKVTEHRYPEAHVAILSASPFALEREEMTAENGRKVKLVSLSNRLNATDYVAVSFTGFGGAWADPEGAVIRTLKGTLRGTGGKPTAVISSSWRNRVSALGSSSVQTAEGWVYSSARVVEMRELGGALTFLAVTETSKIEADTLREGLERSTQLLR